MSKKQNTSTAAAFDCTAADLPALCRAVLAAGKVPFVLGPPGLGKSTMMAMLARTAGRVFRDIRLAYYSPTDVGGMPYLDRDGECPVMRFARLGLLPSEPGSMVMLDEFPLAARATQNATLQLVLDGRVGDYTLPEDTWIVMAGNRAEDRCFSERLSPAMVNRIVVFRIRPDLKSWVDWALDNNIDPILVSYVQFNPNALLDFDPSTWDGEGNFASPRAWEALDRIMKTPEFNGMPRDLRRILIVGTVGKAVGSEFSGYLEVYEDLPSIESVLLDPEKAPVPTEASARIAAAAMVANHANKTNLGTLLRYAARFEKMYEVFAVKALIARDKSLLATADIIKWVAGNNDVFRS